MKAKDLFGPVDMTVGNPVSQIVKFTIPMLLGNIAQQLYNTVDSIIVGRFVGDNALAAVGSAGPIVNLMMVLFMGIAVGSSIMVSQYFGARQADNLSRAVGVCISLTFLASVIIMIIGPLLSRPLLELLGTPESIIDGCQEYLTILFLGFLGTSYYNILSGVLRGLGDSVSALLYLLAATALNIIGDYSFVVYFNMGIGGVALATVLAQAVSAVLCLIRLSRMRDIFEFKKEYLKPDRKYSWELIRLGLPSGITQAIFSMSMIIVQSLTNSFGEQFIAANVIVMRVDSFVMMPAFSFGSAMTTYAGQNIGAKQPKRVSDGTKMGTLTAVGVQAALLVVILLAGRFIMGIFTNTPALVDLSYRMMCILAPGYLAMGVTQSLSGVMRGAGDTMTPMWISIITTVAIRLPLAYGLVAATKTPDLPTGDCAMMFYSMVITWALGALFTFISFRMGRWKTRAVVQ